MADEHFADGVGADIVDIEFSDPPWRLQKAGESPGAPFAPRYPRLARNLEDRSRRLRGVRAALKRTGCRVTALDEAIAEETGVASWGRAQTQAEFCSGLAGSPICSMSDGTGYADLDINGHRETWPVRSKGFTRWLARAFFDETNGAPNSEALAVGAQRDRGKSAFRRRRARRSCPRRQSGRQALRRCLRSGVARRRDQRRRVAHRGQSAGARFGARRAPLRIARAGFWRINRRSKALPQRPAPVAISS